MWISTKKHNNRKCLTKNCAAYQPVFKMLLETDFSSISELSVKPQIGQGGFYYLYTQSTLRVSYRLQEKKGFAFPFWVFINVIVICKHGDVIDFDNARLNSFLYDLFIRHKMLSPQSWHWASKRCRLLRKWMYTLRIEILLPETTNSWLPEDDAICIEFDMTCPIIWITQRIKWSYGIKNGKT